MMGYGELWGGADFVCRSMVYRVERIGFFRNVPKYLQRNTAIANCRPQDYTFSRWEN